MLTCTCGKYTDFTGNGCTMDDEPVGAGLVLRHVHNTLAPCWTYLVDPADDRIIP